ncbi:MAG: hypothetical protein GX643_15865 [Acidimicrobiales bacterium]|nr:hypothetical protein [Acidimicrobiales bacterium]
MPAQLVGEAESDGLRCCPVGGCGRARWSGLVRRVVGGSRHEITPPLDLLARPSGGSQVEVEAVGDLVGDHHVSEVGLAPGDEGEPLCQVLGEKQ